MKINYKLALLLLLPFLLNHAVADTDAVVADDSALKNSVIRHQLSLAAALQAAEVSITSCRKQGLDVSAAVVDSSGLLQVLLRDTNATPISAILSQRKAFTAANFQKDTTQLANLSDTAVGRSGDILMSAGGVLIKVDGIFYGALGVSGAVTGAKDDECARAGMEAISEGLSKKAPDTNQTTEPSDSSK